MMRPAIQTLYKHFQRKKIKYQKDPDGASVRAIFGGTYAKYHLVLKVDDQLLQVFAHPGFSVPEGARGQIAELICRANYGLKIGRWELDMDDGEIGFHASTALANGKITAQMIELVMGATFFTLERYASAMLSCIYGNEAPADAVRFADAG